MVRTVFSAVLVLLLSWPLSAAAGDITDKSNGDYIIVEIRGTLESDIMAIGGETTGVTITAGGVAFELDLGGDAVLQEAASRLHGKTVLATGTYHRVAGVEIPRRDIVTVTTLTAVADDVDDAAAAIDENALSILKSSTDLIAASERLAISAEFGFDVVQEDGRKLEFGASRKITVRRPNQARIEFTHRNGDSGSVFIDGKEITLIDHAEKVYAKAHQHGDIDAALDFMVEELEAPVPLGDFFSNDPYTALAGSLEAAAYVEESVVAGVPCHHLALSSGRVDYQVWIAQGDKPLPRRIVITYVEQEGQPQFWAQFLSWDLDPQVSDSLFAAELPEGAERIPFAVRDEPVEGAQP